MGAVGGGLPWWAAMTAATIASPSPLRGAWLAVVRGPEGTVFAVADVEAEHLTPPVGGHSGGHDDGLGYDPVVDAGLAVGGIEEHVAERLLSQ